MLNDHDYYFYFVQIAVTPEVLQYASRYLQILILASSALTIVRDVDVVPRVLLAYLPSLLMQYLPTNGSESGRRDLPWFASSPSSSQSYRQR